MSNTESIGKQEKHQKRANGFSTEAVENQGLFQCPEDFGANKGQTKGKRAANKGQQYKNNKNKKKYKNSSYEEQHVFVI